MQLPENPTITNRKRRRSKSQFPTHKAIRHRLRTRRLEFALIEARAAHVTESIKNRYSSDTRGSLEVFCVGNSAYEKFCRKGNTELVKASGVPDLRRFCHGTMADAQLRDARHLVRSSLPSLLNSVDIWASGRLPHGAFDEMDKSNIQKHLADIHTQVRRDCLLVLCCVLTDWR